MQTRQGLLDSKLQKMEQISRQVSMNVQDNDFKNDKELRSLSTVNQLLGGCLTDSVARLTEVVESTGFSWDAAPTEYNSSTDMSYLNSRNRITFDQNIHIEDIQLAELISPVTINGVSDYIKIGKEMDGQKMTELITLSVNTFRPKARTDIMDLLYTAPKWTVVDDGSGNYNFTYTCLFMQKLEGFASEADNPIAPICRIDDITASVATYSNVITKPDYAYTPIEGSVEGGYLTLDGTISSTAFPAAIELDATVEVVCDGTRKPALIRSVSLDGERYYLLAEATFTLVPTVEIPLTTPVYRYHNVWLSQYCRSIQFSSVVPAVTATSFAGLSIHQPFDTALETGGLTDLVTTFDFSKLTPNQGAWTQIEFKELTHGIEFAINLLSSSIETLVLDADALAEMVRGLFAIVSKLKGTEKSDDTNIVFTIRQVVGMVSMIPYVGEYIAGVLDGALTILIQNIQGMAIDDAINLLLTYGLEFLRSVVPFSEGEITVAKVAEAAPVVTAAMWALIDNIRMLIAHKWDDVSGYYCQYNVKQIPPEYQYYSAIINWMPSHATCTISCYSTEDDEMKLFEVGAGDFLNFLKIRKAMKITFNHNVDTIPINPSAWRVTCCKSYEEIIEFCTALRRLTYDIVVENCQTVAHMIMKYCSDGIVPPEVQDTMT
jgi:hypothetical protein